MRDDEVPTRRSRPSGWRWVRPGADVPDAEIEAAAKEAQVGEEEEAQDPREEQAEGPSEPADDEAGDTWRRQAREEAERLALAVNRIEDIGDRVARRRALERLLAKVDEMGFGAAALGDFSSEHLRLVRLVVRHWNELSQETRDHSSMVLFFLDHKHPAFGDLIVESARTGDETIFVRLYLGCHGEEDLAPYAERLAEPLGRIVDEGPTDEARSVALRWISVCPRPAAAPWVRTALRRASHVLRWRALDVLLEMPDGALHEDDVVYLVEQAVNDPPRTLPGPWDEEMSRAICYYPDVLAKAIVRLRPAGARAPLVRIANNRIAYHQGQRECLDQEWGLCTLAAAFPSDAIPLLDRLGLDERSRYRRYAAAAAAHLPEAAAVPRLRNAALDASPEVAHEARDAWLKRFGSPLALNDLDALPPMLRPAAPSAVFLSRLAVLRGTSEDARRAMAEVLLGEPPDAEDAQEHLALLVLLIGDDAQHAGASARGMPADLGAWLEAILDRYGPRAVPGIAWMARRQPVGYFGWWHRLRMLLPHERIAAAELWAVRAAAADWLESPSWDGGSDVIELLGEVGPPPELKERLLAMVLRATDQDVCPWLSQHAAAKVLAGWPADADLDGRIVAAALEAHAASSWDRLEFPLRVGVPRRLAPVVGVALGVLADPDRSIPFRLRQGAADALAKIDRLPDDFVDRSLADPAHPAFRVACEMSRARRTARQRRLIRAALDLPARDGDAAVDALVTLLYDLHRPLSANNPRIPGILARASLVQVARALNVLFLRKVRVSPIAGLVRAVFTSTDPAVLEAVTSQMVERLDGLPGGEALFDEIRPLVRDPELAEEMDAQLRDREWLKPHRRRKASPKKRATVRRT